MAWEWFSAAVEINNPKERLVNKKTIDNIKNMITTLETEIEIIRNPPVKVKIKKEKVSKVKIKNKRADRPGFSNNFRHSG